MKKMLLLLPVALAACNDGPGKAAAGGRRPTPDVLTGSYCYLGTGGDRQQDSTRVALLLNRGRVSGTLEVLPHEKDARRGRLRGTVSADGAVEARYRFSQEGIEDSIPVRFRLLGDTLLDVQTGARLRRADCR